MRSCAARQHRYAEVRRAADGNFWRALALSNRVRRAWRHEPRRPDAEKRLFRRATDVCSGRKRGAAWAEATEVAQTTPRVPATERKFQLAHLLLSLVWWEGDKHARINGSRDAAANYANVAVTSREERNVARSGPERCGANSRLGPRKMRDATRTRREHA